MKKLFITTGVLWLGVLGVALAKKEMPLGGPVVGPGGGPVVDEQLEKDIEKQGFHYRFDYELENMRAMLQEKLDRVQKPLYDKATLYPDAIRWELIQNNFVEPELTVELNKRIAQYTDEYNRMVEAIALIDAEISLRDQGLVDRTEDIKSVTPSTEQAAEALEQLE